MSTVLDIEDSDIIGRGDNGTVVRVGHKLDGEDVTPVPRHYRSGQAELRRRRFWVVRMDVDAVVIRAGG